jgi:hypothetical protein
MKIIQVATPAFEFGDTAYWVESRMFESFTKWDEYVQKQKEIGATHCFIFSIDNTFNGEIQHPDGRSDIDLITIRSKFLKLDPDEHNLGKNVRRIEKMLRGDEENE